jgi:hypothetical protein
MTTSPNNALQPTFETHAAEHRRMRVFDAWLFGRFPVLFPTLLGLVGGAWAMKLAFNPPPEYEGRGILRWLWIALALAVGTGMFLRAMGNA